MNYLTKLAAGMLLLSVGASPIMANNDKTWRFKVYLSDKEIGQHVFLVSEKDNQRHISIKADFDVNFLFINAYSYEHSNYEIWSKGCLTSIQSFTNDNGDKLFVKGERTGEQLTIESPSGVQKKSGCIKSFAYWDPSFLESKQLLNAQTGEVMSVMSDYVGTEKIVIRNKPVKAERYKLHTDDFTIDLWYAEDNQEWLALNSTTSGGSTLRYEIQ
jgi:hypothetical protein